MNLGVLIYHWLGFNELIFWYMNAPHGVDFDRIMLFITELGDRHNFLYYLAATAIILMIRLVTHGLRRPKAIIRAEARPYIALLLTMGIGFALYAGVTHLLKDFFAMPRPYAVFPGTVHFAGPPPDPTLAYQSFPSGHAAMTIFLVTAWWPHLSRFWRSLGVCFVALVCFSRMNLGMHFPADIAGGLLIGFIAAKVTQRFIYRLCNAA